MIDVLRLFYYTSLNGFALWGLMHALGLVR